MSKKPEANTNFISFEGNNIHSIYEAKAQRNIPAQIWAKRNMIKKLVVKQKFDQRHKIVSKRPQEPIILQQKGQNEKKIVKQRNQSNEIFLTKRQTPMRKLSLMKQSNFCTYTETFLASNLFSTHGVKTYHYDSSASQGNNFINVSKAVICPKRVSIQKNESENKAFHSQREMKNDPGKLSNHRRTYSETRYADSFDKQDDLKKKNFFKVTSKEIHLSNVDKFVNPILINKQKVYLKRSKTEVKEGQTLKLSQATISRKNSALKEKTLKDKKNQQRPKSCVLKQKKNSQYLNCQGWNTKRSEKLEDQPFISFLEFL